MAKADFFANREKDVLRTLKKTWTKNCLQSFVFFFSLFPAVFPYISSGLYLICDFARVAIAHEKRKDDYIFSASFVTVFTPVHKKRKRRF